MSVVFFFQITLFVRDDFSSKNVRLTTVIRNIKYYFGIISSILTSLNFILQYNFEFFILPK